MYLSNHGTAEVSSCWADTDLQPEVNWSIVAQQSCCTLANLHRKNPSACSDMDWYMLRDTYILSVLKRSNPFRRSSIRPWALGHSWTSDQSYCQHPPAGSSTFGHEYRGGKAHLVGVIQQGLDIAVLLQQGACGHEADALHSRHIVGGITHERKHIRKLAGLQALEFLPESAQKDNLSDTAPRTPTCHATLALHKSLSALQGGVASQHHKYPHTLKSSLDPLVIASHVLRIEFTREVPLPARARHMRCSWASGLLYVVSSNPECR